MSSIPPEIPVVPHDDTALAMMVALRKLAQSVVGFNFVTADRRRKINVSASLPDEFLEAVAVACDASSHLASSSQLTGIEVRDAINFSRAFLSVADELEILARGLRGTVALKRAEVGVRALRAYTLAKTLNRPDDRQLLIPHLAKLRAALGRSGVNKKKPVPEDDAVKPDVPVSAKKG